MKKRKISHIIADVFDVPLEGIANVPNLQLIGNTILNIDGCVGIKKYESDEIILRSKEFLIHICGDSLSMSTFSQGRISIRGLITAVEMESKEV